MTAAVSSKENSLKRWRAALLRARADGVEVRQLAGSGMWIATSGSDEETAYEVTPWECECHAGQFTDPVCKHRAALLWKLGRLYVEQEPQLSRTVLCEMCNGMGTHPGTVSTGRTWRYDNVICEDCHGTGRVSAQAAA